MMKYAFNGRFLTKKITGQERFAMELISHLDDICEKDEFCVVTPKWVKELPKWKNVKIVQIGSLKREAWEIFCLGPYLSKHKLKSVNLTSTYALGHSDIICIHDISIYEIGRKFIHSIYGFVGILWKFFCCEIAIRKSDLILTVSEYSKSRLHDRLKVPENKISVIYNGWQHLERIYSDDSVLQRLGLNDKEFYFSLSSLSPQKNFIWIKEIAKRNPQLLFVVTGKAEGYTEKDADDLKMANLLFTGYLTDGEIKSLMQHCRAFIHPAIYEGFGIPPLEALSCGAQIIVSTATCLPEIYKNAAHYIDPYDYNVDIESVLKEDVAPPQTVLKLYDWKTEATKLLTILRNT